MSDSHPHHALVDELAEEFARRWRAGERPAVEMERLYGERIEQLLFTVRGLSNVSQIARSGQLITRVSFDWDADIDLALVDVNKAVAPIAADPEVEEVRVRRFDPRQMPVIVLGLVAVDATTDLAELRRIAERQIAPALEQLDGVADLRHVVEEGRHFAVVETLDGELDACRLLRRRRDGVAALCPVAVGRGEAHIDMLTGAEREGDGRREHEALHPRRVGHDLGDDRLLPAEFRGGRRRRRCVSHR